MNWIYVGDTLNGATVNQCLQKVPRRVFEMHNPALREMQMPSLLQSKCKGIMQICDNQH